jgi:hypothetical protein
MEPLRGFTLSGIVLLSLILPLAASSWQTAVRGGRRRYLVTVWIGQLVGAGGGVLAITSPIHPEFGLVVAVAGCLVCLPILHRQLRLA